MSQKQIYYSDKYDDEKFEYRHVMLPKDIAKRVPKTHLMSETEWRNLGVQQSQGWVHYMIHQPEPHILLFRRPLPAASHWPLAERSTKPQTRPESSRGQTTVGQIKDWVLHASIQHHTPTLGLLSVSLSSQDKKNNNICFHFLRACLEYSPVAELCDPSMNFCNWCENVTNVLGEEKKEGNVKFILPFFLFWNPTLAVVRYLKYHSLDFKLDVEMEKLYSKGIRMWPFLILNDGSMIYQTLCMRIHYI